MDGVLKSHPKTSSAVGTLASTVAVMQSKTASKDKILVFILISPLILFKHTFLILSRVDKKERMGHYEA